MKKRYYFMDVIRIVSMLAIVFYHMVFSLYQTGIRQLDSVSFMFQTKNMHIATVGVGLFFMISGAGLMYSSMHKENFSLKEYYKKRFFKILVPFYLVYILWLITFMLLTNQGPSAVYNHGTPLTSIIYTLLGMDAYLATFGVNTFSLGIGEWFLGALVMMYIVFPLLRKAMLKNKWITLLIATIYFIIIVIIYPVFPFAKEGPGYVPGFTNFLCKIYEFILGMFLITIVDRIPQWLCLVVSIPITCVSLFCPVSLFPSYNSVWILIQNVGFFLLFMGLEKVFKKLPRLMKVLALLAGFSYEFFLIHHVVIDYITLQHSGVPFSNIDILVLFVKEFVIISVLTILVKCVLGIPSFIKKRHTNN